MRRILSKKAAILMSVSALLLFPVLFVAGDDGVVDPNDIRKSFNSGCDYCVNAPNFTNSDHCVNIGKQSCGTSFPKLARGLEVARKELRNMFRKAQADADRLLRSDSTYRHNLAMAKTYKKSGLSYMAKMHEDVASTYRNHFVYKALAERIGKDPAWGETRLKASFARAKNAVKAAIGKMQIQPFSRTAMMDRVEKAELVTPRMLIEQTYASPAKGKHLFSLVACTKESVDVTTAKQASKAEIADSMKKSSVCIKNILKKNPKILQSGGMDTSVAGLFASCGSNFMEMGAFNNNGGGADGRSGSITVCPAFLRAATAAGSFDPMMSFVLGHELGHSVDYDRCAAYGSGGKCVQKVKDFFVCARNCYAIAYGGDFGCRQSEQFAACAEKVEGKMEETMADHFGASALAAEVARAPAAKRFGNAADSLSIICRNMINTRFSAAEGLSGRPGAYVGQPARTHQLMRNADISAALGCNSGSDKKLAECSVMLPCKTKPACMKENNLFPKCHEQKHFFGYH